MAARRCSTCAINFPIGIGVCHVCGEPTSEMNGEEPHENWVVLVEEAKAAQAAGPLTERDRVEVWRLAELLRADYPLDLAERLAASEADLHQALELVTDGCSHELAARILL